MKFETFKKTAVAHLTSGRVMGRVALQSIVAGSASALCAHIGDPQAFDWSPAGVLNLKRVAIGGALLAVVHLFMAPPKP